MLTIITKLSPFRWWAIQQPQRTGSKNSNAWFLNSPESDWLEEMACLTVYRPLRSMEASIWNAQSTVRAAGTLLSKKYFHYRSLKMDHHFDLLCMILNSGNEDAINRLPGPMRSSLNSGFNPRNQLRAIILDHRCTDQDVLCKEPSSVDEYMMPDPLQEQHQSRFWLWANTFLHTHVV